MHEKVSHRIKSETVMTSITYIVNYCANKQTKNKSLLVIIIIIIQPIHRRVQYASKVAMHRSARIEIQVLYVIIILIFWKHTSDRQHKHFEWNLYCWAVSSCVAFVDFQVIHFNWRTSDFQFVCCLKEIERARVSVRALSFLHFGIPMHGWPFDFFLLRKKKLFNKSANVLWHRTKNFHIARAFRSKWNQTKCLSLSSEKQSQHYKVQMTCNRWNFDCSATQQWLRSFEEAHGRMLPDFGSKSIQSNVNWNSKESYS